MSSKLRLIAVHVEEPEPMRFSWVLSERSGSRWDELQHAEQPAETYRQAMAEGLLALQALVPDLDAGPRDEPVAEVDDQVDDPAPEAPKRGSLFGFGPAR